MSNLSGAQLLQGVAERIIIRYLGAAGYEDISRRGGANAAKGMAGCDISYHRGDRVLKAKVKPDSYFGTDASKVADRSLPFYRAETGHYAFESIADPSTREPGWMFNSRADELLYYYVALAQTEEEVSALLSEPDEVFFSELGVERDELRILPMAATQAWFEANYEDYAPRPVAMGSRSAWYRLIPCSDIDRTVGGIKRVGTVFHAI